jgi:hypothetical protein
MEIPNLRQVEKHAQGICGWLDRKARIMITCCETMRSRQYSGVLDRSSLVGFVFATRDVAELLDHLFKTLLDSESEGKRQARSLLSDCQRRNLYIAADRIEEHYADLYGLQRHGRWLSRKGLEGLIQQLDLHSEEAILEWTVAVLASVIRVRDDHREVRCPSR